MKIKDDYSAIIENHPRFTKETITLLRSVFESELFSMFAVKPGINILDEAMYYEERRKVHSARDIDEIQVCTARHVLDVDNDIKTRLPNSLVSIQHDLRAYFTAHLADKDNATITLCAPQLLIQRNGFMLEVYAWCNYFNDDNKDTTCNS